MEEQYPRQMTDTNKMSNKSDDPRINRIAVPKSQVELSERENWITWEIFHQKKRGDQVVHVGIVHAPNADMALVFAKEQYGRRQKCTNLWAVKTTDVHTFDYEDEDIFTSAVSSEKKYREAAGFQVRDKINKFKKEQGITAKARN